MDQVPIEVLRALRDVEQIVRIEQQALGQREQDLLRFHIPSNRTPLRRERVGSVQNSYSVIT